MTADPLARLVRTLRSSLATADLGDADLLARIREPDAVEALVRRHGPRVLAACRTVLGPAADADDAFQATFLVLLKNPAAVRNPAALGAWLYGTARRIALQARRKRRPTGPVEDTAAAAPDLSWREAVAVLHEELDRLPNQFRQPLTLCYLDGLARDEAAKALGCSLTTVKGRLERGREVLRKRLTKRGISLSAGLLAAAAGDAAGPCPPLAEVVTPAVNALARGVGRGSTVHAGFVVGLAASVVCIGVAFGMNPQAAETPTKDAPKPAVVETKPEVSRGRVLDGDGKPAAGAAVYWVGHVYNRKPIPPHRVATTAADGTFAFDPDTVPKGVIAATLVTAADGWAPDWRPWKRSADETTLRLAPDVPIKGRLLDLEGKPVAGAVVRVSFIAHPRGGDWVGVATAFRQNPEWLALDRAVEPFAPAFPPEVRTDAAGRFELRRVGADRIARLRFHAPGIEAATVHVVTNPKFDPATVLPKPGEPAGGFDPGYRRIAYGPTFEHAARPSQDIVGTATDRATGRPVAGVALLGTANAPDAAGEPQWHDPVETTTDKDGRYRLTGLPKAARRFIHVQCGDAPYLDRLIEVKDVEALKAATADIQLDRCLIVEGVLKDQATGKPVVGEAKYLPRPERDAARGKADTKLYRQASFSLNPTGTRADTDAAGRFRLRVPHGPGLILARADTIRDPAARYTAIRVAPGDRKYLRPHDPDAISTRTMKPAEPDEVFDTGILAWPLRWENGYAIIDAQATEQVLKVAIAFDPGVSISGTLVAPDGKPVAGAVATGTQATNEMVGTTLPTDRFTAAALSPGGSRPMFFIHEGKGLVGTYTAKATDQAPVVKLQPWGVVTGRVVTPDGKPAANAEVSIQFSDMVVDDLLRQKLFRDSRHAQVRTDAAGRFRLDGQFPGFEVWVFANQAGSRSGAGFPPRVTPKSDEVTDLGDIKLPGKRE